jgi:hypothetical protein
VRKRLGDDPIAFIAACADHHFPCWDSPALTGGTRAKLKCLATEKARFKMLRVWHGYPPACACAQRGGLMPRAYELPLFRSVRRKGRRTLTVPDALQVLGSSGSAAWCRHKRGILGPACCPVPAAGIQRRGLRACNIAWCDSTETGGSATELSATDAWRGAAVGDAMHIRLIGTIARSNFGKNAWN